MIDLDLGIKIMPKGEFTFEALNDNDEVVRCLEPFDNLILNSGLDWILNRDSNTDFLAECRIGTGNLAESATQTQLQSQVDKIPYTATGGSRDVTVNASAPYYEEVVIVFLFPAFTTERNISEVGVGPSTVSSNLFTRALTKDVGGDPTSITVLVGEKLRVTYRCRLYYQMDSDATGTVNISGVDYSYTGRLWSLNNSYARGNWFRSRFCLFGDTNSFANYAQYVGGATGLALATVSTLPPRTGSFSYGDQSSNNFAAPAYVPGSFTRVLQLIVPDTVANFTPGLNWCSLQSPMGFYQFMFTPAIPKTADYRLRLNFTFTVARYAP